MPRDFIEDWSHKHPLPGMWQDCRLPEGKQVFSINRIVLHEQVRHMSHWYQLRNGEDLAHTQVPAARQGPALEADVWRDS